jgi:hypothetical protein
MLKIRIDARAKCGRHPGYDPAKSGRAGIVGGCGWCEELLRLYESALEFERQWAAAFRQVADVDPSHRYAAARGRMVGGSAHFRYGGR